MTNGPANGNGTGNGPAERRRRVREQVLAQGFARVEELAQVNEVSAMTMHRDLDALEAEGWLIKIRGGATANPAALLEAGVAERMASMQHEKKAIAAEAAHLLTHGQTVFLDDSTTAFAMVETFATRPPMLVATNFLEAVDALRGLANVSVHLFGGEYQERTRSTQGLQTIDGIDRTQADLCFMSTTAITSGRCLHRSEPTVVVRQALMRNSAHNVLLVDHAKFGRRAPHVLCEVSRFDTVIVDEGVDEDDLRFLRESCADVRVARSHPPDPPRSARPFLFT